jgi:succinate dehydrogenase/fumarate reductase cytochrome b subunit
LINNLERGDISVRSPEISQQVNRLERAVHRITGTILFTALLLGGIQLYLGDEKTLGAILLGFAAISLSWMAFRSLK